jgi:hypothetical protein
VSQQPSQVSQSQSDSDRRSRSWCFDVNNADSIDAIDRTLATKGWSYGIQQFYSTNSSGTRASRNIVSFTAPNQIRESTIRNTFPSGSIINLQPQKSSFREALDHNPLFNGSGMMIDVPKRKCRLDPMHYTRILPPTDEGYDLEYLKSIDWSCPREYKSIMHVAIEQNRLNLVKLLIENGLVDINQAYVDARRLIHSPIGYAHNLDRREIFDILLPHVHVLPYNRTWPLNGFYLKKSDAYYAIKLLDRIPTAQTLVASNPYSPPEVVQAAANIFGPIEQFRDEQIMNDIRQNYYKYVIENNDGAKKVLDAIRSLLDDSEAINRVIEDIASIAC